MGFDVVVTNGVIVCSFLPPPSALYFASFFEPEVAFFSKPFPSPKICIPKFLFRVSIKVPWQAA